MWLVTKLRLTGRERQHAGVECRSVKGFIALGLLSLLAWSGTTLSDTLSLGENILEIELASTSGQWYKGLMHRKSLGENEGMLFVYPDSKKRTFWMKDTYIPLSIGFFDAKRRLMEIARLDPPRSVMQINLPETVSQHPARYVLEVRQGWFKDHEVALGSVFELQPE